MSTRTTFRPASVITNGDMSLTSITSSPTILQSLTSCSYQAKWSGTSPVGTLSVQFSNDYSVNPDGTINNAGTWTTIYLNVTGTPSQTVSISGNTGSAFIDIDKTAAYAVRLIYTKVSGTGTLNALIDAKVS